MSSFHPTGIFPVAGLKASGEKNDAFSLNKYLIPGTPSSRLDIFSALPVFMTSLVASPAVTETQVPQFSEYAFI